MPEIRKFSVLLMDQRQASSLEKETHYLILGKDVIFQYFYQSELFRTFLIERKEGSYFLQTLDSIIYRYHQNFYVTRTIGEFFSYIDPFIFLTHPNNELREIAREYLETQQNIVRTIA